MDDRTLFLPLNEGDSESFCPEKEQRRWSSSMVTEDLATDGSWSQSSISRSLQRAETLLRSTFNPSLKWLFHGPSPHEEEEEEEEEGHFVAAHNLTSRSSARLVRLQQALLTMAPQWLLVSGALMGPPQVYVKGLPAEGGVVLLPSSSSLHGNYRALRGLLRQRSLLLFMHEFTRRAHRAAAYISRVNQLLEDHLKDSHRTLTQSPSSWSSLRVGLSSLSQELRIHINHWSCLFSKVHSDHHLRSALVQQTRLLMEVKQTLDLLGLQALSLMEQYVFVILSSFTQTKPDCVSRDLLEDILAGTQLYNQAVWERVQYSSSQLRAAGLQQAHYSTLDSSLYPAAFSVRELMMVLALHHANMAAKELYCWAADHNCHINHEAYASSHSCACPVDRVSCRTSALRSEWTWNQLQQSCCSSPLFSSNQHSPSFYTCPKTPSAAVPDLHLDSTFLVNNHPLFTKLTSVQNGTTGSNNDQSNQCQTVTSQTDSALPSVDALLSVHPNLEGQINLENCKPLQTNSTPSATTHPLSGLPLSGVCHQDHSSVELLFQSLVSSNDLLSPLGSHIPNKQSQTEQLLPNTITDLVSPHRKPDMMISSTLIRNTPDSEALSQLNTEVNRERHVGGAQQEWTEVTVSSDVQRDRDSERQETVRREGTAVEPDCLHWSPSVWWLDLGQSPVLADLFRQYHSLLWTLCSKALWLQLHVPHTGQSAVSINLQHSSRTLHILHRLRQASNTDAVPKECRVMLEDFSLYLFTMTAHSQWDHVMCRSLGSALKDKCLRDGNRGSSSVTSSSEQDGSVMTSLTMEFFLLLSPPLISCLCCHHSECRASGLLSCWLSLQRHTVNLALATVQMSTIWVMFKAYQFLSSWSLSKFLLITQGDLKVLIESLDRMLHQTKSLMMNSHTDHHATLLNHNHNQFLLSQQLEALDSAMSKLQAFSAVMLKTFSSDCKRMSGEIFEQTMPSAVHWRPSLRTGFPSSPSEYASLAAQTVIGQVLEGVAPLSDDARVQALSVTMTAFMEAWMEHILKQRIKFSVQGALQLKQDFDSIRELIQSDRYGLSAELHQRLLSLRVFQQVDSAVVCLLQQPQAKPYLQPRAWEPFTRCCPANISQDSINAVVGGSITNLRCMEGEDLNQSDPSLVTTDLPQVDPSTPAEPYLAPSLALGNTQQEWLDLRIHSNTRRWRLPGLQCLSKSEP